jgi:hypothetical protein
MPQLIALLPEDGWAFVKEGDRFVLVHPPFRTVDRRVAPEPIVSDAILHHSFMKASPDVPDEPWADVIARIRGEMQCAASAGAGSFVDRALGIVPMTMIEAILDDVERSLIPQRKLDGAERALRRLLLEERVRAHATILARAIGLLALIASTRERQIEARRVAFANERLVRIQQDPRFARRSQSFRSERRAGLFGG